MTIAKGPFVRNGAVTAPSERPLERLKVRTGPAGLLFFDRRTGCNVLVDEVKTSASAWDRAPRQVSVALTNACDLACGYCYAPKDPGIAEFASLTKWLRDLDTNGCIGVGFGGGEPTLYPKLSDLCLHVTRETNLAVTMTTHAHRLSDRLLDELSGHMHFVRVSMDGIGKTYESLRGRSFDVLLDRITRLSRNFQFGINFVVNSATVRDLDRAVNLAGELGASEFLLLPEVPVGKGTGIDGTTATELREWVSRYRGSVRLCVSEKHADGFPVCAPLKEETGLCAYAHIDAHGVMKATSYSAVGVRIGKRDVMSALDELRKIGEEGAVQ